MENKVRYFITYKYSDGVELTSLHQPCLDTDISILIKYTKLGQHSLYKIEVEELVNDNWITKEIIIKDITNGK